jgi:hypothetical protein
MGTVLQLNSRLITHIICKLLKKTVVTVVSKNDNQCKLCISKFIFGTLRKLLQSRQVTGTVPLTSGVV